MSVTVSVSGFQALAEALDDLKKGTRRNILLRAAEAALEPIAEDMRNRVPVDEGQLKDSIGVAVGVTRTAGNAAFSQAMRGGATRAQAVQAMRDAQRASRGASSVELFVGPEKMPHAHLVEFGSVHNTPVPYIRGAWEAGKNQVLQDLETALWAEINKAAARAQRRAANAARRAARAAPAPILQSVVP